MIEQSEKISEATEDCNNMSKSHQSDQIGHIRQQNIHLLQVHMQHLSRQMILWAANQVSQNLQEGNDLVCIL